MKAAMLRTSFVGLLLAATIVTPSSASGTTNQARPNVVVAEGGKHAACPNCGHGAAVAHPAVAAVPAKRFGFLSFRRGAAPKVDAHQHAVANEPEKGKDPAPVAAAPKETRSIAKFRADHTQYMSDGDERSFDEAVHQIFQGEPPTLAQTERLIDMPLGVSLELSRISGHPSHSNTRSSSATYHFDVRHGHGHKDSFAKVDFEKAPGSPMKATIGKMDLNDFGEVSSDTILRSTLTNFHGLGVHELVVSDREGGRALFARTGARWAGPSPRAEFRDFLIAEGHVAPAQAEKASHIADNPRDLVRFEVRGKKVGREFLANGRHATPDLIIPLEGESVDLHLGAQLGPPPGPPGQHDVLAAAGAVLNAAYERSPHAVHQNQVAQAKLTATQKVAALRPMFNRLTAEPSDLGKMMNKLGYASVGAYNGKELQIYGNREKAKLGIEVTGTPSRGLWLVPTRDGQLSFIVYKDGKHYVVRDNSGDRHAGRGLWSSGIRYTEAVSWDDVVTDFPDVDTDAVKHAIAKFTETAKHQAAALPAPK
jgi:hypothetical protein